MGVSKIVNVNFVLIIVLHLIMEIYYGLKETRNKIQEKYLYKVINMLGFPVIAVTIGNRR